jgi:hypothetical protein
MIGGNYTEFLDRLVLKFWQWIGGNENLYWISQFCFKVMQFYYDLYSKSLSDLFLIRKKTAPCEVHSFYSSPYIIMIIKSRRMDGGEGRPYNSHGADKKLAQHLVRKPVRKRWLGKPRRRWEDSKNMGVVWIYLAQDRDRWRDLMNTLLNSRVY